MPVDLIQALYLKILIRSDSINAVLLLIRVFLTLKILLNQIEVND